MADLQITSLPALAEAGIQSTDVLALADLSATETKKVTVKDLIAAGVALIDSGDIPAAKVATPFATNAVATATIQDDAVNADKLATNSVTFFLPNICKASTILLSNPSGDISISFSFLLPLTLDNNSKALIALLV